MIKALPSRLSYGRVMHMATSPSACATPPADLTPSQQLTAWSRLHGGGLRTAAILTTMDALPAIGFAAGLAGAMGVMASRDGSLWPWLLLALVSLIVRAALGQAAMVAAVKTAGSLKAGIRGRVLSRIFSSGNRDPADMTAAVEGIEALDGYVSRFTPLRQAARIAPLIIIAACAFASPVAAGILLFTLLPFAVGMALVGMAAAGESRRQFQAMEALAHLYLDRIRALPLLISFQAEARATAEVALSARELASRTGRVLKIAFLSSAVLEFFAALSVALVAVYCGFNLLRLLPFPVPETLTLSRAFFVLTLAPEVYAPIRRLAAAYHDRQAAEAAVPALAGRASEARSERSNLVVGSSAPTVDFSNVQVRYGDSAAVLTGFNLHVPACGVVALTGASGSGKSSLLHLLLGLAPLTSGEVRVGTQRLTKASDFAGAVAWASQTPIVIPGSLRDNIALAHREATTVDILRAAAAAGLSGDLDRSLDERGGGLSGGERRRLGLARALLSNAPLLLLDEPTANLDATTERDIIEALRQAMQGRTTIIATHSPAVMTLADQVVCL